MIPLYLSLLFPIIIATQSTEYFPRIFKHYQPTGYNYSEVLRLSLLFYEAQRSGYLPKMNRIPWRGDSGLTDKGENGEDLTGGYYDAGDFVKFSFTMVFTTTVLAWGILSYQEAYIKSNQYSECLSALRWATNYFIKCHPAPNEFYGQVGNFDIDHKYWGRPEDMNLTRPAYKIDEKHPGSDLAGEAAAALAAVSIVFRKVDPEYSKILLTHAKELYDFAFKYRGLYHESIPSAVMYYESTDYGDELTWAALWLYKATNHSLYLETAEFNYIKFHLQERPNDFFYNKKVAGIQVLLAQITNDTTYRSSVKAFCDFTVQSQKKTPKGLVFIDKTGTLSQAANVALICLQAAAAGIETEVYQAFAKSQINYMLGDSGKSYLVGFGKNWPKQPTHAASSCPNRPEKCDWTAYHQKGPNPQVLYGALVSGPNENDYYEDSRQEYPFNEVSLDFNAGFQSAVAGLYQSELSKQS